MMPIAVQGVGVVGGFGCGVERFQQALISGSTHPANYPVVHGGAPLELPAFRADTERLKDFVPIRALRRVDRFSRLGMLGAYLALEDAGILSEGRYERLGVIIATGLGPTGITFAFEDTFIQAGDMCASPTYFAHSVHNSVAANISLLLGATGPNCTVTQFHLSVPAALQTAWLWLAEERVDRVLFGAVDELSELIAYAFYRRYGVPPAEGMNPMVTRVDSAVIGEGAAFMLLSRREESREGYCLLDRVDTGRHLRSLPPWSEKIVSSHPGARPLTESGGSGVLGQETCGSPEGSAEARQELLVLGADGRRELGAGYASLATGMRLSCFTPHYGSSPAGPAFDLAAAALMLKGGVTFPTPDRDRCDFSARVSEGGTPLTTNRISCLTLGEDDGFGLIRLTSQGRTCATSAAGQIR
jgi:3-oxoacyl-[acyl-carrier-protein] synthase II